MIYLCAVGQKEKFEFLAKISREPFRKYRQRSVHLADATSVDRVRGHIHYSVLRETSK